MNCQGEIHKQDILNHRTFNSTDRLGCVYIVEHDMYYRDSDHVGICGVSARAKAYFFLKEFAVNETGFGVGEGPP